MKVRLVSRTDGGFSVLPSERSAAKNAARLLTLTSFVLSAVVVVVVVVVVMLP